MKYGLIENNIVVRCVSVPIEGYYPLPEGVDYLSELRDGVWYKPVRSEQINTERDRRILQGKTFTLASGKQISLQGDETTKENLQALAFAATLRIQQGAENYITLFRDATDFIHELTQTEILDLWSQSAAFVSQMFQAAWFLKDGPQIPSDYTEDIYWEL